MNEAQQGIVRKPPLPGREFIGCDLDGTLAYYDKWRGRTHIGEPIPLMVQRVREWLAEGDIVCIFTSRVADETKPDTREVYAAIHAWTEKHIGERLFVTAVKQSYFARIYDDKCVRVTTNMGMLE